MNAAATAALRTQLADAGRQLLAHGLSRGTSGNISARRARGMLITPSAVPYADMTADMIVALTLDGAPLDEVLPADPSAGTATGASAANRLKPSTEWRMHAAALAARPDVQAVVHAHPPFATALACLRRPIPAFHYMVAAAGGHDIPCTPYAGFGSAQLAQHAAAALRTRDACLLANHGIVAIGRSIAHALALAVEVETLAEQYCRALQVGSPVLLTTDEMDEALAAFANYAPFGVVSGADAPASRHT